MGTPGSPAEQGGDRPRQPCLPECCPLPGRVLSTSESLMSTLGCSAQGPGH